MKLFAIVLFAVSFSAAVIGEVPSGSCGLNRYHSFQPFIVGGTDAGVAEFPYQVSLQRYGSHTCGGSIIAKRWILSAAHCFDVSNPGSWVAIAGMHNLGLDEPTKITLKPEEIIRHEDYNPFMSDMNDVALMKLRSDIEFNDYIQPVCLADGKYPNFEKETLTATGWGAKFDGGFAASILQKVELPVIPISECAKAYPGETMYEGSLCAGNLAQGGIDTCQGDSGGPLVHRNKNGSFVQVGITSWGYGCGAKGQPGVYTRVSEMYNWIWETISKN